MLEPPNKFPDDAGVDPNVDEAPPKGFLFGFSAFADPPSPPRKPPPPDPPNIEPDWEAGAAAPPNTDPPVEAGVDPNTDAPEEAAGAEPNTDPLVLDT